MDHYRMIQSSRGQILHIHRGQCLSQWVCWVNCIGYMMRIRVMLLFAGQTKQLSGYWWHKEWTISACFFLTSVAGFVALICSVNNFPFCFGHFCCLVRKVCMGIRMVRLLALWLNVFQKCCPLVCRVQTTVLVPAMCFSSVFSTLGSLIVSSKIKAVALKIHPCKEFGLMPGIFNSGSLPYFF